MGVRMLECNEHLYADRIHPTSQPDPRMSRMPSWIGEYSIGIVGSLSRSSAICIDSTGGSVWVDDYGLQFREMPRAEFRVGLSSLLIRLCGKLGIELHELAERTANMAVAVCGVDSRHRSALQLQYILSQLGFGRGVGVYSVPQATYEGAFPDSTGVLIRAGAGSSVFARGPLGEHLALGLGTLAYDVGSAYAIGRRVIPILWDCAEGRARGRRREFGEAILADQQFKQAVDFFDSLDYLRRDTFLQRICNLTHSAVRLAYQGDGIASRIVSCELARLARAVERTASQVGIQAFSYALAGGLFEKCTPVIPDLCNMISQCCPESHPHPSNGAHNRTVGIGLLALSTGREALKELFREKVEGKLPQEVEI